MVVVVAGAVAAAGAAGAAWQLLVLQYCFSYTYLGQQEGSVLPSPHRLSFPLLHHNHALPLLRLAVAAAVAVAVAVAAAAPACTSSFPSVGRSLSPLLLHLFLPSPLLFSKLASQTLFLYFPLLRLVLLLVLLLFLFPSFLPFLYPNDSKSTMPTSLPPPLPPLLSCRSHGKDRRRMKSRRQRKLAAPTAGPWWQRKTRRTRGGG